MVTKHQLEQGSEEWLKARNGKFTGSNAIKLLKYGKRAQAMAKLQEFKGNYWTKRGHNLEPFAIQTYELVKEVKVETCGFMTNSDYPDCLYSPDGWHDDTLIEVKCFKEEKHLSIKRNNIPAEILAQIHFGLIICELEKANLVLFSDEVDEKKGLRILPIKRDRRLEARLKSLMKGE